MPSKRVAQAFADIIRAADLIQSWVAEAGGAAKAIMPDTPIRNAIERQLLVVSEAAIRLHKLDKGTAAKLAPDIDWAGIRGIGNYLRHKYDDIDATIIADVLHTKLDDLRRACIAARSKLVAQS